MQKYADIDRFGLRLQAVAVLAAVARLVLLG
jgi:hypothetical protein